jgi:hypothetical protein
MHKPLESALRLVNHPKAPLAQIVSLQILHHLL